MKSKLITYKLVYILTVFDRKQLISYTAIQNYINGLLDITKRKNNRYNWVYIWNIFEKNSINLSKYFKVTYQKVPVKINYLYGFIKQ